jgi:hypothetical protein
MRRLDALHSTESAREVGGALRDNGATTTHEFGRPPPLAPNYVRVPSVFDTAYDSASSQKSGYDAIPATSSSRDYGNVMAMARQASNYSDPSSVVRQQDSKYDRIDTAAMKANHAVDYTLLDSDRPAPNYDVMHPVKHVYESNDQR